MLKQQLISSCITGILGGSFVRAANSQTTAASSVHLTATMNPALVSPRDVSGPDDLPAVITELPVQPMQSVRAAEISSPTEPITQLLGPVAVISVPPLPIRVLVASDSVKLSVATSADASVLNADGAAIATLPQAVEYEIQPNSAGIKIGDMQFPALVQIALAEDGLVYVNGHWYRGLLTLANVNGELLAINSLDLEQYLYSVVGGEMPSSWNSEALGAQVIAARSYALAHIENPVSAWYDLGNDERYQVYQGIESEASATYAAVVSTDGQVLVKDGHTLTALYASTDEVSNEAHSGLGMSQVGAANLADSGVLYEEILAHYYLGGVIYRLNYI